MPESEEKVAEKNREDNSVTGGEKAEETKDADPATDENTEAGNRQTGGEDVRREFEQLVNESGRNSGNGEVATEIDMLMDVDVTVSIELGRTVRSIEDILKMAPGRIIELDRPAGENVDIYLNDKLFARGEVTVIDENYAVRVTEIAKSK